MKEVNNYIRYGLILLLLILSYFIIKPYLTLIILSLILAYMAFPLYKRLRNKWNENLSAAILTISIFFIIVIPLLFLANSLFQQAANIYTTTNIEDIKDFFTNKLNLEISETTQNYINSITKTAISYILKKSSEIILSIPNMIVGFFMMLFILFFALRDGEKVMQKAMLLLPLEEHYKKRFQKKLTTSIESLFYGIIALAAIEAVVAIIGFYFLGISAPILWGFVIGLTAIIPGIGATLIWIPMSIIAYFQGNTLQAILIALFGFFILSTLIDTVIRAKIMGMRAETHPLIIVIGVLGGLSAFGFIGMFIGPLILSLFELVLEIYVETRDETTR